MAEPDLLQATFLPLRVLSLLLCSAPERAGTLASRQTEASIY